MQHITIRLETNPYIKSGQGNTVEGKQSQEQEKELEIAIIPTVRNPTRAPAIQP